MIKDRGELKERGIEIDLSGPEGNAYVLMAYAQRYAKQLGMDHNAIIKEMKSSDYENLVNTFEKYFGKFVTLYR
jgi:hypothetical protein